MSKKALYFISCLLLGLLLNSCDDREILLAIDLPYEGQRLYVFAFVENGQQPEILIESTRPIDGTFQRSAFVDHADVKLFNSQGIVANCYLVSDTTRGYEIQYGLNIFDGTTTIDTLKTLLIFNQYYTTTEPLTFVLGESYWLTVEAEGYPDIVSDPVIFKDEISATDFQYSPPTLSTTVEDELVFDQIDFTLRKEGEAEVRRVEYNFHSWSQEKQQVSDRIAPFVSSAIDLPAEEQVSVFITTAQPVMLPPFYENEFNPSIEGGRLPADGAALILSTYNAQAVTYQNATSENSKYIGGFFPPNPSFPHTVSGGYGIFTIVEKDTIILQ